MFVGDVVNVPKLQVLLFVWVCYNLILISPVVKAPGFIKAQVEKAFPDASHCSALQIRALAKYPYDGYRFSFGTKKALFCSYFSGGFKSHFDAPVGSVQNVVIPFTNFTDCNSDATGEPKPGRTCADNEEYCPDQATLEDMKVISVWGEGVAGQVHLEIHSVSAVGCSADFSTLQVVQ